MSSAICITWSRGEKHFVNYLFHQFKLFCTWKYEMGPYPSLSAKKNPEKLYFTKSCLQKFDLRT